ncbi:peptidase [Bifidobacterium sp. DSM 109957]|uniref:Peptidase n=2 Tax=Bifidobacterium oedipodis TaxID=2675322 RepID=A0A7Y0ERB4_9BIFI|nr:peptidase [Bifidobacterium sp. DSM 109957]
MTTKINRHLTWQRMCACMATCAMAIVVACPIAGFASVQTASADDTANTVSTIIVRDGMLSRYTQLGGAQGILRQPLENEHPTANGGAEQRFQGGTLFWNPSLRGSYLVRDGMLSRYTQLGGPAGRLGLPCADELAVPGGASQVFQGGTLFWNPSLRGAYLVRDGMLSKYAAARYEQGPYGLPVSDEYAWNGGARQDFQYGSMFWNVSDWWKYSSQGPYPNLAGVSNLNVAVSIASQRVYIRDGERVLYTMITSTGINDWTPRGTYRINGRGPSFYNRNEAMGARNWVRFIGNFLFHSVPIDSSGNYIVSEAWKLGQPASHGCIRLTVADSQWFYNAIPDGTLVSIW